MYGLQIQNVYKSFGSVDVLNDINLAIRSGEFLILVGPSGCGKSTLLNMIAGLESVSSGDIVIGERIVTDLDPKDRDIAMVFQSYALYPNMTVRENITFGLHIAKVDKTEQQEIVTKVAQMLQIEPLLERKPKQLSGGQRQRVAMGRALARDPSIFLFDEPLSNLDAKLRVEMRSEIKQLHQRMQTTIVYVTHDQIEAMTLGDRIAVMRGGTIEQFGTPNEIYDDPANMFVAGFIGSPSMNFIPCEVMGSDSGVYVEIVSADNRHLLPVADQMRDALQPHVGQKVLLGLRPEQVVQATDQTPSSMLISSVVDVIEPTGPDTLVTLEVNNTQVGSRFDPHGAPSVGEQVQLHLKMDKAVFFEPTSEKRII